MGESVRCQQLYMALASFLTRQEMPLVVAKTWFLDQQIPAGGFIRIQDSSQKWEERVHETGIIKKKV